jgi:hypothetical protein
MLFFSDKISLNAEQAYQFQHGSHKLGVRNSSRRGTLQKEGEPQHPRLDQEFIHQFLLLYDNGVILCIFHLSCLPLFPFYNDKRAMQISLRFRNKMKMLVIHDL